MVAKRKPTTSPQYEKLLYFLMLRQMETESSVIREAYQRLADSASHATGWDLRTVILDWLETELRTLDAGSEGKGAISSELMKAAVALGNALKQ